MDVRWPLLFFPESDFIFNYLHVVQKWTKNQCGKSKNQSRFLSTGHRILPSCAARWSLFSDLNFASYVLYIYLCYVTCHTHWAWVIYVQTIRQFLTKNHGSHKNHSLHLSLTFLSKQSPDSVKKKKKTTNRTKVWIKKLEEIFHYSKWNHWNDW